MVLGWNERWTRGWHFHLKEMCVATALQRQGIGRRLIDELENRLAGRGVHRVFLETGESAPARRFYEASGYRNFRLVSLAKSIEASTNGDEPAS
jgi:ribosomal protein S18 acetylase RimI-like enzyme